MYLFCGLVIGFCVGFIFLAVCVSINSNFKRRSIPTLSLDCRWCVLELSDTEREYTVYSSNMIKESATSTLSIDDAVHKYTDRVNRFFETLKSPYRIYPENVVLKDCNTP